MKVDKYDRQIRLWGKKGQQKLTFSKIALVGADGAGIQALKNLALPGVGYMDIWDQGIVTQEDLSLSFFYAPEDLGRSKAEAAIQNLLQMNPLDVKGKGYNKNISQLIQNEQALRQYSLIIACNLLQDKNKQLSEICFRLKIPVVFMTVVGFYIYIRNQKPMHFVQSENNTSKKYYMRLHDPFPALSLHSNSVNIFDLSQRIQASKDQQQKRSILDQIITVPYPIILIQVYHSLDKNQRKKDKLIKRIKEISMPFGQDFRQNFNEAASRTLDLFQTADNFLLDISIFEHPHVLDANEGSPVFLLFLKACKHYYDKNLHLPQPTKLPDIQTSTKSYLQLKKIYKEQHQLDVNEVLRIIKDNLGINRSIDSSQISQLIENIQTLKIIQLPQYKKQLQKVDNPNLAWEGIEWRHILLSLRAYKIFEQRHNCPPKIMNLVQVKSIAYDIKNQYGFQGQLDQRYSEEICRVQGKTTISLNSIAGAIAGQQAIKLLTNCFTPIKSGYLFSGVHSIGYSVNL